jgi:hypothetical protein
MPDKMLDILGKSGVYYKYDTDSILYIDNSKSSVKTNRMFIGRLDRRVTQIALYARIKTMIKVLSKQDVYWEIGQVN